MSLERAQLGLLAAIAATCLVSIFAAQVLFALALVVYAVRLARGETTVPRLPVDGPILKPSAGRDEPCPYNHPGIYGRACTM